MKRRAVSHRACATDNALDFSTAYRQSLNQDLNDYGLLVEDAGRADCSVAARDRLAQKIRNTLAISDAQPMQGWLQGGLVALMFAAGVEVYGHGDLTSELDEQLQRVRDSFRAVVSSSCGYSGTRWQNYDTCMDDYAVAASGYAWIATYESKRARPADEWIRAAKEAIGLSFGPESVCMHRPDAGGTNPCNASVSELESGLAEVISLNHGQEAVHYGFGLMTSIAGAVLGLHHAGEEYAFSADEKVKALGLMEEAQKKSDPDGRAFKTNCAHNLRLSGTTWIRDNDADCGEMALYRYNPLMYPLNDFYRRFVGTPRTVVADLGVEQAAYQFDSFDPGQFSDSSTAFQNAGRRVTYGSFSRGWWEAPPLMPERGKPLDDHAPLGALEDISATGVASGWACDADAPEAALTIVFYSDSPEAGELTSARTDLTATATANACTGFAHRFSVQLPPNARERPLFAFAHDATSARLIRLTAPCPSAQGGACVWRSAPAIN